jgi:quinol monooxygenase YgiN
MAKYALYVPLKAKAGKEKDVEAFLAQGAKLAKEEMGTVTWYGLKEGEGRYSVFDTFDNEAGQEAHLSGQIALALKANWSALFEGDLNINKIEILAEKA